MTARERQFNVLVGQRILRARKAAGLSGKQLAKAAGISVQQVYCYEDGSFRCPPMVLSVFAQRMKVSLRDLIPNPRCCGFLEDSTCAEGKLF